MAPGAVATAAQPRGSRQRATRGTKGVALIGLGLVGMVLLVALVFGLARENGVITQARDVVAGPADGWTTETDTEGGFAVELPGVRTRTKLAVAGPDNGEVMAWQADLGTDTDVVVGYGTVEAPTEADGGRLVPAAAYRYLRETVAARWLGAHGLEPGEVTMTDGSLAGLPAVTVHTTQARLGVHGQDAYGHVTFALDGDRLYVLQVRTIYKDAPQLNRMAASFTTAV